MPRRRGGAICVALALMCASGQAAGWTEDEPWVRADSTASGVAAARFEVPDDVYPHRIMGRIPERRVLAVRDRAGRTHRVDLRDRPPGTDVFEDIAPRLADADGDGTTDVVVVQSGPEGGASLAVYGLRQGRLTKIAATPPIGVPMRWLAPVAITDLDGNGITDIAYVETPHLGKRLRVWSWAPGGLTEIARLRGVTNHRIGDEVISGGLRTCGAVPEMVLADADWRRLLAIRLTADGLRWTQLDGAPDSAGFAAALTCKAGR